MSIFLCRLTYEAIQDKNSDSSTHSFSYLCIDEPAFRQIVACQKLNQRDGIGILDADKIGLKWKKRPPE